MEFRVHKYFKQRSKQYSHVLLGLQDKIARI